MFVDVYLWPHTLIAAGSHDGNDVTVYRMESHVDVAIDTSHIVLHITKRLVWADNMFCVPEQLVDSDVVARERARIAW